MCSGSGGNETLVVHRVATGSSTLFTNTRHGQEAEKLDGVREARNRIAAGDSGFGAIQTGIGAIQTGAPAPPLGTLHGVPVPPSFFFFFITRKPRVE